jgi:hypothetical protein
VQHKVDTHIRIIEKMHKILPITKVIVETAKFDMQKINNPNISGVQYQQGSLYEYNNVKLYLMAREHGKCQICGKESTKGNPFRIHHVTLRSNGGTDKADNLALLHEKCHIKFHKDMTKKKPKIKLNKNKQYKSETCMNIIRKFILEQVKTKYNVEETFGYITKMNRINLNLDKTHINDAFVIAGGTNQERCMEDYYKQKRHNNRCLQTNRKGFKPSIRKQRYKWQPHDIVIIDDVKYKVITSCCRGMRLRVRGNSNDYEFSTKKIQQKELIYQSVLILVQC